jgi:uncharacterized membrane protein YraQ (UPF0718 family)
MKERTKLLIIVLVFLGCYYIPWGDAGIRRSGLEAFMMLQEYAREHVLTCLIPAFFIAGAIAVFVSQASVLKYFGSTAKKILSYSVASVSGTVLAVCSCTVLAVLFAVITGLLMAFIFRKDDASRATGQIYLPEEDEKGRTLLQEALFMLSLVLILIFAAFAKPAEGAMGLWSEIFAVKWYITGALLLVLGFMLKGWFIKDERITWVQSTWGFMKQIFPLLGAGVLVAGFMLGRPGHPALIPEQYVQSLVGGNSVWANLFASVSGALMYFATLTEVPILQGLLGAGMGKGPALSLLLAGPALSLPNMLVIGGVMGVRKTLTFSVIIVALSTIAGMTYGWIVG